MKIKQIKAIKATLDIVCGKWKAAILLVLVDKTLRFSEIKARLPKVNHQTLIKQLKDLERDGLITRTKYDDIPPRVEYTLTEYGKELEQLLKDMMDWGEKHLDLKNKKYIDDDILVKEES
ncbi:helix-turn-helix transcriptional regulator [Salipaludibacillus agaradhaerens]|jgi:DNA-binding HxlR family transcriptional regulator|uniref:Helix-turn-helix transcriptional regulator n=2 Tax=Salipaludibacillus agaradhaerens TaxID=76935 RepID=A0A9Q4B200_SALAG|nr:helix-turn-helix domain-containing protein [Salipaludibacillus agaradhaerens]MCR6096923.1 helix-turn-helix transcriptional regulator [Salipaludibacillus agaradhaerens]MCR6113592.1 helix-turn-helix transcriptional regulator [Salipaludibacillus agaradhaerens]UJW57390.1 helix-turn-helix transcriptional regulator [Bacillus sp. A116_S68]